MGRSDSCPPLGILASWACISHQWQLQLVCAWQAMVSQAAYAASCWPLQLPVPALTAGLGQGFSLQTDTQSACKWLASVQRLYTELKSPHIHSPAALASIRVQELPGMRAGAAFAGLENDEEGIKAGDEVV